MGEWIWTNVYFGGKIKRSQMKRVAADMFDEGSAWDVEGKSPDERALAVIEAAARDKKPVHAGCGQTNYGHAEDLVNVLTELELTWRREAEAHYEYDADLTIYEPGKGERTVVTNADHEPVAPLNFLRQQQEAGKTLAEVIAGMSAEGEIELPPVEIVEDYEIAARAKGWTRGGDGDGIIYNTAHYDSWKAAVSWGGTDSPNNTGPIYDSWEECCESENIEVEG